MLLPTFSILSSLIPVLWTWSISRPLSSFELLIWTYFHSTIFIQSYYLINPKLRNFLYNLFVSWVSTFYFSGILFTLFLMPFFPLLPSNWRVYFLLLPFIMGGFGLIQSITDSVWEEVELDLTNYNSYSSLQRIAVSRKKLSSSFSSEPSSSSLKIIQLTDIHIGPFMSVSSLYRTCEKIVQLKPDLVLLTGDFYTPEGDNTLDSLSSGLAPLKALAGKTFACLGNHDKESSRILNLVREELQKVQIKLLVDQEDIVETRLGKVQIIGFDWRGSGPRTHIETVCSSFPPIPNIPLRLMLLHDPKGFQYIPSDNKAVVFSGHTHGGQLGLISFGIDFSIVGLVGKTPDHSFWGLNQNRLYVHRGNGFRSLMCNFVVRFGVPNENSILNLKLPAS